nr:MAG: hypothetical protein [Bacteriophage sp.]
MHYAERAIDELDFAGGYYTRHVNAMTAEGLNSKSAIAAELAVRDFVIDSLQKTISNLSENNKAALEALDKLSNHLLALGIK